MTGDAADRAAIRTRLDATLFVEAGAGTGKTAALVDRVVALVTSDGPGLPVPMHAVAAITFTEKAAAELRERVREELLRRAASASETSVTRERCRTAAEQLDVAAICTLHAFAQRILTEFPIEAGLPPRVQVRDEIASLVAFETRWHGFADRLLEDPQLEDAMLFALAAGVRVKHLRTVAEVLDDNWDLLDRVDPPPELPALQLDDWLADVDELSTLCDHCRDDGDKLLAKIEEIADYGVQVRDAFDDIERVRLLRAEKPSFKAGVGRQNNWPDVAAVRARVVALGEQREVIVNAVLNASIRQIAAVLAECTAESVAERRVAGELEFHDLLVLARSLMRDEVHGPRARARLGEKYQRILVDEFQDTDPIQVELAALLGSADPSDGTRAWTEMTIVPGRLFFVGDPKQSIYRFRRADIATFLAAAECFAGDDPVRLTTNFRTGGPVLEWVNHVFGSLIQPSPASQPEYRALEADRPEAPNGPPVLLLGVDAHDDAPNADTMREREAADVAQAIAAAIDDRWQVWDRQQATWRDARLGDVCVLLPARTSLAYLEHALDDAGIPYRAETSSLVYSSRTARDLFAALRAIDDPSDALSLVTALRSSLFGCGDDDLFTYHNDHHGRWDLRFPVNETVPVDHPVAEAINALRELHEQRAWLAPSELLERIVRDRRVLEQAAFEGRFRDTARRVRFLIDQARAFSDAAGGSLRDYLAWADLQGAEGARVVESVLPETDDDAVQILTIHGAKGLEYPIVVCSGMTTAAQNSRGGVQVLFPPAGRCEIRLTRGVQTDQFDLYKPIDEQMGFHEKLRLLYVGCTRARDHLIVSVHRKVRPLKEQSSWTHAELLWDAAQGAVWQAQTPGESRSFVRSEAPPEPVRELSLAEWESERAQAFARGARRFSIAATTLAHRGDAADAPVDAGLAKEPRDLELPPWNKGRYGTAIGRAVHGVLQTVDLASGDGLDDAVAAQAAAEGVLGHESTIAALCRAALDSDSVRRACTVPRWRETYVAVPFDGLTLEGYVDLLYRDDDGLVIVDYKTDALPDEAMLAARVAQYRVQTAAYAVAVESVTGERVVRCVLCFLDPSGPRERVIEGRELDDAVEEVRRRVRAERDDPSPLPPPVLAEA